MSSELPDGCDVLHIVWSGSFGGVQRHVETLVRGLRDRPGPIHRVCFLEGSGLVADGLVLEGLAFKLGFRRGWGPSELWRFTRALRRLRPSVLHFHSPALGAAFASAAISGATCVFTQHNPAPLRRTVRYRVFYRFFRTRFARVAVPTPAVRASVAAYGIDPDRVVVLPYALTMPLRRRPANDRLGAPPVVGTAARLEQVKRLDVFVDVIAELRKRGIDCVALVVGDGTKRLELEDHVQRQGLEGVVRFVGAQKDVRVWLDGFDVCLLTSEAEIFGMIALEAMARGVPVVAMPCIGGLPDLAERGGLLLPDRQPSTAASVLIDLFESQQMRAELRARGARIAAEHTVDRVLARHAEFYDTLVGGKD